MEVIECIVALLIVIFITGVFTCLGIFLIDKLVNAYVDRSMEREDD